MIVMVVAHKLLELTPGLAKGQPEIAEVQVRLRLDISL